MFKWNKRLFHSSKKIYGFNGECGDIGYGLQVTKPSKILFDLAQKDKSNFAIKDIYSGNYDSYFLTIGKTIHFSSGYYLCNYECFNKIDIDDIKDHNGNCYIPIVWKNPYKKVICKLDCRFTDENENLLDQNSLDKLLNISNSNKNDNINAIDLLLKKSGMYGPLVLKHNYEKNRKKYLDKIGWYINMY